MGGKSQDFGDVAAAQGDENRAVVRDQLYANRPTQYTPWGYNQWNSSEYIDPATGESTTKWENTQGLTPELQEILNKQIAIQGGRTDIAGMLTGRMGNEFGQEMNWDGLNPYAETPQVQQTLGEGDVGNPYETRQRAEDAVYNQAMSRLQPQMDSERQALEIKMRNQGIGPEDEAWKSQMQNLNQKHTDAQNQATWSSVGEGRAESGQMFGQQMDRNQNAFSQALSANQANFGQSLQSANYANALRQSQLAESMQKRGFNLNEIQALLNGQQVGMPQMPSFNTAQAATPAPIYQGAADQASVGAANSPWNAIIGAGATLGSAYMGMPTG